MRSPASGVDKVVKRNLTKCQAWFSFITWQSVKWCIASEDELGFVVSCFTVLRTNEDEFGGNKNVGF